MTYTSMPFGLAASVLQQEGQFADHLRASEASVSTCFLISGTSPDAKVLLVTNAHCVGPDLNLIEIVSYTSGARRIVGTLIPSDYVCDHSADLAVAAVGNPEIAKLGFTWTLPPIGQIVNDGDQVTSLGYPHNGTNFAAIGGASATRGIVQQGSTNFPTWNLSFFTDGDWGPGRSGSPAFAIQEKKAVLLGVNRGRIEANQQPDGSWRDYGWSRIVSVDVLRPLLDQAIAQNPTA